MSKRKYPFYSGAYKNKPTSGVKCEVCGLRATHRVEFQYSWFRSDDEQTQVCETHRQLAQTDARGFHTELNKEKA